MVFIPPTWFEGLVMYSLITVVPIIIGFLIAIIGAGCDSVLGLGVGIIVIIAGVFGSGFIWYELYEVPSVNEEIITVQEWQPRADIGINENGMMVVDSADDLMLVTTNGTCYYNTEHFWFQKFNTRDVFNQLKVNGTYKIQYYGWREPFNTGFPNILSVKEVIDETNCSTPKYGDYFGVKLVS